MLFLFAGCGTPTGSNPPSIIGVWELKEVRFSNLSRLPPFELTNKKEIYTVTNLFYNTTAESAYITDKKPKRYSFKNGIVTIFIKDEPDPLQSKVIFVSDKVMELTNPDGDTMVYGKVSDDPGMIPPLQRRVVPIRRK